MDRLILNSNWGPWRGQCRPLKDTNDRAAPILTGSPPPNAKNLPDVGNNFRS